MPSKDRVHLHVWGIRNCDTVRAALKWLEASGVPHTYHDFRKDGLPEEELRRWVTSARGPQLLNRRSATWRKLDDSQKQQAETDSVPLLLANPTLIKRPVVTDGETVLQVGFSPESLEDYA